MLEFANRLRAARPPGDVLPPRGPGAVLHLDAVRRRHQADPPGFADELDVVLFNHEPQWHLARSVRARPPPRVLRAALRPALRQGGQLGERPRPGRPPARQQQLDRRPDRGRDRLPADRACSAASTATPSSPYGGPKRYPMLCSGRQQRRVEGHRHDPRGRRAARACRSRGTRGKDLDQPALGREYDAARGVRGRELVRGVLPARARGAGVRRAARHDRQRRLSRVRDRRRDRARRSAARRAGDGRRDPAACSTTRRSPSELVAERSRSRRARLRLGAAHRRVRVEILDGVVAGGALAPPPPRPPPPDRARAVGRRARRGTTSRTRSGSSSRCAGTPTFPTS